MCHCICNMTLCFKHVYLTETVSKLIFEKCQTHVSAKAELGGRVKGIDPQM